MSRIVLPIINLFKGILSVPFKNVSNSEYWIVHYIIISNWVQGKVDVDIIFPQAINVSRVNTISNASAF